MTTHELPSELEREIGQLEKRHDQLRDRVKGLEATLAAQEAVSAPDARRTDVLLNQARGEFREAREALEEAWARRNPSTQAGS